MVTETCQGFVTSKMREAFRPGCGRYHAAPRIGVIMATRQRLRVGATYAGKILTVHVEDTHFRVTCDGTEISLHAGPDSAPSRSGKPRSTPRRPNACPATPESVKPCDELKMSSKS
jgi:hypothetical protein